MSEELAIPDLIRVESIKDWWNYAIAVGVFIVAFLQWKTLKKQSVHEVFVNSEKLKHDLFEKRYFVFSAIHEALKVVLYNPREFSSEALYKFRNDILDAPFLFGTDINTYIDRLYNELADMVHKQRYPESSENPANDDRVRTDSFNKGIQSLHDIFSPYMKFELWSGHQVLPLGGNFVNNKTVAKEWLIFATSGFVGFLILPVVIIKMVNGNSEKWGQFWSALFKYSDNEFLISWILVISPYILVQLTRITAWSLKQLREK